MKIEQRYWTEGEGWQLEGSGNLEGAADWVLVFGGSDAAREATCLEELRQYYPDALVMGCSTAGEICGTRVRDDSIVATAVHFEHSHIQPAGIDITDAGESHDAGKRLALSLSHEGLVHVLVLSDGLRVNGSELARGLRENLPQGVAVTGGLAGDGGRFAHTLVCAGGKAAEGRIAALGFYGDRLRVGYGSLGGWDTFGTERLITKSKGNVLYELDGESALTLYKKYLGEHAAGLPATALLFPLALRGEQGDLVRTVLGVDEAEQSMTFAGDMPEGTYARLMKANFDRLVDGASGAAGVSHEMLNGSSPDLAILISCVGRKLVLKQRIEEEVEGVREVLGEHAVLTGFYSYGEICPHDAITRCELHNQTMTITTFSEN
ncbi:MAG: FIST C-terminal domain-containing protein [Sulfuricella denitrificans]|nr:FIST C-terminal domain-containing protein [Sulfuricella denitrificans]